MKTKTPSDRRAAETMLGMDNGNEQLESLLRAGERVTISPPRTQVGEFKLIGMTPYVSNNFSAEAQQLMEAKQRAGSQSAKGQKKAPKDFSKLYRGSMHVAQEGWIGVPASCFRQALVDACRLVGFKMTLAKMGIFILEDGFDAHDGRPLVRIEGEPREFRSYVRLANGSADISCRARFEKWSINLRVEFDLDMFSSTDVANLLSRVGRQVGIGAGRAFSKTSCGQGWGQFKLSEGPNE